MLKRYSEGVAPLELIEEREGLFRLLPSTTPESLHKKTSCYSINPMTRYPNIQLITTNDVSYLFDSDTKPCSLIDKEERGAVGKLLIILINVTFYYGKCTFNILML